MILNFRPIIKCELKSIYADQEQELYFKATQQNMYTALDKLFSYIGYDYDHLLMLHIRMPNE